MKLLVPLFAALVVVSARAPNPRADPEKLTRDMNEAIDDLFVTSDLKNRISATPLDINTTRLPNSGTSAKVEFRLIRLANDAQVVRSDDVKFSSNDMEELYNTVRLDVKPAKFDTIVTMTRDGNLKTTFAVSISFDRYSAIFNMFADGQNPDLRGDRIYQDEFTTQPSFDAKISTKWYKDAFDELIANMDKVTFMRQFKSSFGQSVADAINAAFESGVQKISQVMEPVPD